MKVKQDMENSFLAFTKDQMTTEHGQTALEFLDTWSEMMERAIDMGVDDISSVASLMITPAADAVGYHEDENTREVVCTFLNCWEYGESLNEWFLYSPPELLESTYCGEVPEELMEALHELENSQQAGTFPVMSM